MEVREAVKRLCELARTHIKPEVIRQAKRREAAALAWEDTDYLPLHFAAPLPELKDLPSYDWREQFYDPDKSFVEQIKNILPAAASHCDYVPAIRAESSARFKPCHAAS